jgi:hypothetical protein
LFCYDKRSFACQRCFALEKTSLTFVILRKLRAKHSIRIRFVSTVVDCGVKNFNPPSHLDYCFWFTQ